MEREVRPVRWWWLGAPLAISSLGWAFAPYQLTSSGWDSLGASLVAGFAGILATALTGPATIVVLHAIGAMPRIGWWQYAGIVFAVALPVFAFESLDVQASAMPAFLGKWVSAGSAPFVQLWLGSCFVALYAVFALATYPFARRGRGPATLAVVVPALLIFGWIAYGISCF
jgi:hypothetical protein